MDRLLFAAIVFLFIGCSSEPTSTGKSIDLFDTEAYLDTEFINQTQFNITKTISYNDEKEVIKISNYDIIEDLSVLKQANINNSSWVDKYTVETIDLGNGRTKTTYIAVDPKLQIKKMIVSQDDKKIISFEALQERNALISTSSKRIFYESSKGYQISTTSKNLISPERTISIEVKF